MKISPAVLVFLVLLAVGFAAVPAGSAPEAGFEPARAPSRGPADAPVTIVEIADFM